MSVSQHPAAPPRAALTARSADPRSYVLLTQVIAVSVAVYLLTADWRILSVEWISRLLLLHFIWALWSWRRVGGTLVNPYVLFMISCTLFNAGLVLVAGLNLNRQPILPEFPVETIARSLLLVFAALTALHLGALFGLGRAPESIASPPEFSSANERAMRIVGWTLLAIAFVPWITQVRDAVSIGFSKGYMALYQRDAATAGVGSALIIGTDLLFPGFFLLIVGSRNRTLERRIALLILTLYGSTFLFLGFRAGATMPLVALVWLWDRTMGRLPRKWLFAVTAFLFVGVFPFIRETRDMSAAERGSVSVGKTYAELDEHPAVDAIIEMGGSILPLAYTVELVPKYRPYENGLGYFYAALTIVPSLFWDRHPTVARGSATEWLIETVDPDGAKLGTGLGFSFIAEEFMNFGWLGVPLISFLLGYGAVWFWLWAERSRDPGRFVVVAILLPSLLFFARGEFSLIPRSLVWYGLVPYAAYLYVRRLLEARHATA